MAILTTSSVSTVVKPVSGGTAPRIRSADTPSLSVIPSPSPTEAIAAPSQAQVSTELAQVQQAVDKLKQSLKPALANSLEFQIDDGTGKTVVKILDVETKAVVRQIPSEELLTIARALDQMQGRGGLVKQRA